MIILYSVIIILILYFYITKNHDYWSKRNIKHDNPIPLFGNHLKVTFRTESLTSAYNNLYYKYPEEKVVGYYRGVTPVLIIRDTEIIRDILNVDFEYFYARGLRRDDEKEPMFQNLFHTDGDTWKLLRKAFTPVFTSAKIKAMFPLIIQCADKLQVLGSKIVDEGGEFEAENMISRFTIEFIGVCGFGIKFDTINTENSAFVRFGRKIFENSWQQKVLLGLWDIVPIIRNYVTIFDKGVEDTLKQIVRNVLEERNYKPIGRNDFVDHLIDLMNKGKIIGESIEHKNPDGTPKITEMKMDFICLAAQVFVFFAAGFETSSASTSYTLHELAFHPELQQKIQEQIDEILLKYNNKLCYEAITEMTLLNMAYKESLRMLTPLGFLTRQCTKKYTIPNLDVTIDPGTKIIIPVQALHNDAAFFDSPDEYKPERFASDVENKDLKYVYLPFGEGPRRCIAARLGVLQSMAGLAAILQKFTVVPSVKTCRKLKIINTHEIIHIVEGGKPLKLKLRTK